VIDLVSKDGTRDILQKLAQVIPPLKVIFSPENKNVVDAYKRGYQEAISDGVNWILEIDAGFSHKPDQIPQFFETMMAGNYDCVFGSRFCPKGRIENGSFQRFVFSLGGTWLINAVLGTKFKDMTSGFELFKKEALCAILNKGVMSKGPFFQTEIRAFAHQFRIIEVPIIFNSATPHFHRKALEDSFKNLKRLYQLKLKGELY
jgi:dolichol-phosphate mannosyltransferase